MRDAVEERPTITRYVVLGAGAVGGVVAGELSTAGHEVALVARGEHLAALRTHGLTVDERDGSTTHALPAVGHPRELDLGPDDVVLLAVKGQDTAAALEDLAGCAPPDVPVVCLQNGTANEEAALRWSSTVLGALVMLPGTFLEPGRVLSHSHPVPGMVDVARVPAAADQAVARRVAGDLGSTRLDCRAVDDVLPWKRRKLLMNLGNVVDALCGDADVGPLVAAARAEGADVLRAAGLVVVDDATWEARRGGLIDVGPAGGTPRQGSSSWQSLARGVGSIETDFLNGEVVRLGRLHGVPTPVNGLLQQEAREHVTRGLPPGTRDPAELLSSAG